MGKTKEHRIIDGIDHIQCLKCGQWLPLNEETWKPNKAKSSGWYTAMCRECFNAYYRNYYKESPEKLREKERKYKEKNPEKYAEKQAKHHQRYKEAGGNKYCNRNIENCRKLDKNRRDNNPARKEWERKHRIIKDNRRRVLEIGASGSHEYKQFETKFKYHGERCYYCHTPLILKEATEDHRIPLSRGGTDWIANIVPACRSCNSGKGAKTEQEYWKYLTNNRRAL